MSGFGVVFAGGGCRAFWALGVYERLRYELPDVDEWAGVSAGSAMALAAALNRSGEVTSEFCARADANASNFHWTRLLKGQRPFPQEEIYRDTITSVLTSAALDELADTSPVRILRAEVEAPYPSWRAYQALRAYKQRRKAGVIHGPEQLPKGIHAEISTAQELGSCEAISDAILASSASPPITRTQRGRRGVAYDGCLVDNVPVRALQRLDTSAGSQDRILVLLNRPMERLPSATSIFYFAPAARVPIRKWDYTSPERVRRTIGQGRAEAEEQLREILDWLT